MTDVIRRGVTLTEALQEAAAIAPIGRAMLLAYELWHPSLAEPIRFVDDNAALLATLEADAPRDASTEVEFIACPVSLQRPEESDGAASPTVSLARPDVGGLLKGALDAARGSLEPWTLIERVFASDDTSTPAKLPPMSFELTSADITGAAAKITALFDDDANVSIPRITFRRSDYPGLAR
jgi:Domain of unknown function (DUF1833)